jgi:hypothetical protein
MKEDPTYAQYCGKYVKGHTKHGMTRCVKGHALKPKPTHNFK